MPDTVMAIVAVEATLASDAAVIVAAAVAGGSASRASRSSGRVVTCVRGQICGERQVVGSTPGSHGGEDRGEPGPRVPAGLRTRPRLSHRAASSACWRRTGRAHHPGVRPRAAARVVPTGIRPRRRNSGRGSASSRRPSRWTAAPRAGRPDQVHLAAGRAQAFHQLRHGPGGGQPVRPVRRQAEVRICRLGPMDERHRILG